MALPVASPVVIRFGRLGDTVLLAPLLRKLHQRYGTPCRLVSLGECARTLYQGSADVAQVHWFASQHGWLWTNPRRLAVALALRSMREAPFYICEPDVRTRTKVRPMLALAGIAAEHCVFIEDIPLGEGEHWADWLLRFADLTPAAFAATPALDASRQLRAPSIRATPDELAEARAWLAAQGVDAAQPLVLLQPANKRTMRWNGVRAADDDDKSWPVSRWAKLASAILQWQPDAHVLLCGCAAEAGYLASIRAEAGLPRLLAPTGGLPLGLLRGLMELAHSMVSVDTGPAHLAAATGCPLVVLFGHRWPSMWVPRSASGSAVTVLGGLPHTPRVDQIGVEEVAQAWWRLPPRPVDIVPAAMGERRARVA
ncbi:glycosyltransferase family 9 protein [Dyella sp. 2RAB6]|uniref:glycosyltransferase family 9 protein n=1 Tax=Dyella sp. 2RAB6 TaxID=3232992 RepID=UPI003F91B8BB